MENTKLRDLTLSEKEVYLMHALIKKVRHQRDEFKETLDDEHSANDWIALLTRYATRNLSSKHINLSSPEKVREFRENMLIVSGIAVNAIDACNRKLQDVEIGEREKVKL